MPGTAEIPYRRESGTERRRRRWLTALAYVLLAAAVLLAGQLLRSDRHTDRIVVPPSAGAALPAAKAAGGLETTGGTQAEAKATGPKASGSKAARPKAATRRAAGPDAAAIRGAGPDSGASRGGAAKAAAGRPTVASSLGGRPAENGVPRPDGLAAERAVVGHAGTFRFVPGFGPLLGRRGPVRRFRVAVEQPASAETAAGFAEQVDRVLGDGRSWIAGGRFRLRRVPGAAPAEFTIYLASAGTSERMCRAAGLETGGYTSCRIVGRVIINDDRWENAVRGYGAPLATYRAYAINHEVGHQVGHRHERCPGRGRPAPVMMQQTFGLRGCVANPWPYLGGHRYAGPPAR